MPSDPPSLHQKVALVTGAADGIGHAIAQAFAEAGATVEMSDLNSSLLEDRAQELSQQGLRVHACACDVADTPSVEQWVSACLQRHARLHILVNNAAVAISGDIREMPEEDWDQVLNTNLTSAFRAIKLVLPNMIQHGSGSIINIGSVQGHRSWDNWSAYAAAKGGLQALTRQLAGQFGPQGIRVNTLSPGAIDTPLNKRRAAQEGEAFVKASQEMHALRRFGIPAEVAQAALFLASDASSFITGQDLLIDGGLSTLPRYFA